MRTDIEIKEISNGFVVTYDEDVSVGRGREIETYCKTIHELNNFVSDYFTKVEKKELKDG